MPTPNAGVEDVRPSTLLSPATTQTTRHHLYALDDIPAPHAALYAPSRSVHPHSGVLDTALSRIGCKSYLRLHAQCMLPAFLPLSTIPVGSAAPSTTCTTTAIATHRSPSFDLLAWMSHRYLHGSATVYMSLNK
jgi:hypothetical protein